MTFCSDNGQTTIFFHLLTQFNVCTTTSHVRGNRNGPSVTRSCDHLGLLLMTFCIQNLVIQSAHIKHSRKQFRYFHCRGSDKNRTTRFAQNGHVINDGIVLLPLCFVNKVLFVISCYRPVCRDDFYI